jgi:allantoate deiminase
MKEQAQRAIRMCRELAAFSEEMGKTTRTFLSPPMKDVHRVVTKWMCAAGMKVGVDVVGNLHGFLPGTLPDGPRLLIGSHLDTVPDAGAFDGVLGVVLGILLAESLRSDERAFGIEVIGFSEEEGVRFGTPFIGSRALVGSLNETDLDLLDRDGVSVRDAIQHFGLDLTSLAEARLTDGALGYLEFHIEQGPVLERLEYPLGIVTAIVGQSRMDFEFLGKANHSGTTPITLRQDALAGAAEFILAVEEAGKHLSGLVATVGRIDVTPNATNAVPGRAVVSLDIRHACDDIRRSESRRLAVAAQSIADRRRLRLNCHDRLDQPAVPMNETLCNQLEQAVRALQYPVHRMVSGAGHDAMIVAPFVPSAMLFLRSPGGVSHCPEESVLADDIEASLKVGLQFFGDLEKANA